MKNYREIDLNINKIVGQLLQLFYMCVLVQLNLSEYMLYMNELLMQYSILLKLYEPLFLNRTNYCPCQKEEICHDWTGSSSNFIQYGVSTKHFWDYVSFLLAFTRNCKYPSMIESNNFDNINHIYVKTLPGFWQTWWTHQNWSEM